MQVNACAVRSLCAFLIGAALAGCSGGGGGTQALPPPVQKPGVLSISAFPRFNPAPTTTQETIDRLMEAFDLVYGAGARGQFTSFRWSGLEPTQGNYDAQQFSDLNAAITNAQINGMVEYVGIQVINTTSRELPAELQATAFDDPAVKAQFHALLDRVLTPANRGRIAYLSIGNEVDAYLRAHPTEWPKYKAFYEDALQYAHTLDPNVKVGVTAIADGALMLSPSQLADLNAQSDVIILTYYPIQSISGVTTVRDPSVVANDFVGMLNFAGAKALLMQEVGYPAAVENMSSEALQAQFVSNVFTAWKAAGGKIPFPNFFLLHDFTQQMCEDFATYYGAPTNTSFKAYLCSIGLRKDDGTPRAAWSTLQSEATQASLP
jgi:hypothetical protein